MPPKKKGNKKAQDDWEADLGESVTPQDATAEPQAEEPAPEEDALGGGLMAAIQKRGKKKNKKGADQDWVEGEDPTADGTNGGLAAKAPEEANFDDDDVFAGNFNPKKAKPAEEKKDESKEAKTDDGPRVKTKAEKEKEKKEKEKQRKKEMVCAPCLYLLSYHLCDLQMVIDWNDC